MRRDLCELTTQLEEKKKNPRETSKIDYTLLNPK